MPKTHTGFVYTGVLWSGVQGSALLGGPVICVLCLKIMTNFGSQVICGTYCTFPCCATNRQVAGSIPAVVSGFFIDIKSLRSHYDPGVDSASNRNEYQEYFLGVNAAGA